MMAVLDGMGLLPRDRPFVDDDDPLKDGFRI
jgi:hypothetical protein